MINIRNFKIKSSITLRKLSCANRVNLIDIHIRKAHAAEIFRSSFYEYQHTDVSVSVFDLDQLILSEKVRPSLLINPLELTGKILGTVTRILPKNVSNFVTEVVDDATLQVFNDSIRDLQATNNDVVAKIKRKNKLSFLVNILCCLKYEIIPSINYEYLLNINKLLSNNESHT